ncbi:MAG: hypothetical protein HZA50_10090 [Planctomycetes bacterium]|nr:hypothetical protein [Planctomycetota bacterium]
MSENSKIIAESVRKILDCVLEIDADALERAVQESHESTARQIDDPPEAFEGQGITRQMLRMFWHFRSNLEAVAPPRKEGRSS